MKEFSYCKNDNEPIDEGAPWFTHHTGLCERCFNELPLPEAVEELTKPIVKKMELLAAAPGIPGQVKTLFEEIEKTFDMIREWV